jgi:hypothetical protein
MSFNRLCDGRRRTSHHTKKEGFNGKLTKRRFAWHTRYKMSD